MGICVDLMNDVKTSNELQFAAQQAALYGQSFAMQVGAGGLNDPTQSQAAIKNAILKRQSPVNMASAGPTNGEAPVGFVDSDVSFVQNPSDTSEYFLQVSGRRDGAQALTQFFWPIFNTSFPSTQTATANTVTSKNTVRVFSQIACRIGAGAPVGVQAGTRLADFLYTGALPIVISNEQYNNIVKSNAANAPITLSFVTSAKPQLAGGTNVAKAAFTNLTTSGGTPYNNPASGLTSIRQLESVLSYFSSGTNNTVAAAPPGCLELGSQLAVFDPSDATFSQELPRIAGLLASLTTLSAQKKTFVVPVVQNIDTTFATRSIVVGFALLRLTSVAASSSQSISITFALADSAPVLNASCGTFVYTVAPNAGQIMSQPPSPFLARRYDPINNSVLKRYPGLVLAPALAPIIVPST